MTAHIFLEHTGIKWSSTRDVFFSGSAVESERVTIINMDPEGSCLSKQQQEFCENIQTVRRNFWGERSCRLPAFLNNLEMI